MIVDVPPRRLRLPELLLELGAQEAPAAPAAPADVEARASQSLEIGKIVDKAQEAGFGTTSNARAVKAGLTFRPISETAVDTLAWLEHLDPEEFPADKRDKVRSSGITREKELAVLAKWHQKK